jgi:lysosomal Pro-X carboxypeptidase
LFRNVTPDYSFYAVVTKDFKDASESCYTTIKNSWGEIDRLASQPGGLQNLSKIFNTCTNLTNITDLHDGLIFVFEQAAQYDYPEVKSICHAIDSAPEGTDILGRVSAGIASSYFCLPVEFSDQFDPWLWQTCTEMVFPMAQNPNKTMFPLNLFDIESYAENCKREYGVLPRPDWVATEYGGHNIKKVLKHFGSNIIFSNGLRDPWSSGSVLENISESIVALATKEGTHCQDLFPSSPDDPEWIKEQKSKEIELIKSWIERYNSDILHK